jgi:hypothetical protein
VPSPAEADSFNSILDQIAQQAARDVIEMARGQDHETIKRNYPDIAEPYGSAAADVTTEWYRGQNPDAPYDPEPAPLPPTEQLDKNVDWAVNQDDPLGSLIDSLDRYIRNQSRATVKHNADREGVRWARHARPNACSFCAMLATRETLYVSKQSATRVVNPKGKRKVGDKYHDLCHCVAVPIRAGDSWEPPDYVGQWEEDYLKAAAEGGDMNDIVNHMRRAEYARAHEASPTPGD